MRLYLIATVSKLRYDWTCQLESEQGLNPRCRFTAAKHVKDQTGFRSMYFGVGLLLHYAIKLNKNLETRIHSNQEYPWDDRTKIQILVSRPFAICRAEGNVIALRGRYLFHIACEFVFLYYLDNELNVPWRMLKGWLERIAILLTIKLSSRNECSELWITIVDKKRVYLAFYYMLIFFIFSLNRFYQTRKESIPSLGNYWTNVTASKKKMLLHHS